MSYQLSNGFTAIEQDELEYLNGGTVFQDEEDAAKAAFTLTLFAIFWPGPAGKAAAAVAAYAYYEGATADYSEPYSGGYGAGGGGAGGF